MEIIMHKAPKTSQLKARGKALWSVNKDGPWVEVEAAAKKYFEMNGWDVSYGIIADAEGIIASALFTIFRTEKTLLEHTSFISSGQQINRLNGIAGHIFDAKDKDAYVAVEQSFRAQGIDLEGPLQFLKIVVYSSSESTNSEIDTRKLFFINIYKYLSGDKIEIFRPFFEKWIALYTKKLRKVDANKGFRFAGSRNRIDPDYARLRLESFVRANGKIDFSGYQERANAAYLQRCLNDYKRQNRDHLTMYKRGSPVSKPRELPASDLEISQSDSFRDKYGEALVANSLDCRRIKKWEKLISNLGLLTILNIVIGDHEKWSKTQSWFGAGDADLFMSRNGEGYFCEIKSPNDRIHQSQRDFEEFVAKRSGIKYLVCNVKPSAW